jgi:hypothetical protein
MSRLHRHLHRLRRDDSGSALILALLVVLVVGAMLAATLQYQGTGFLLAPQMRNERNQANYVQGAVEGAINQIRGSSDIGKVGAGAPACPSFQPPVPSGVDGVSGHTFRVDCTPEPAPGGSVTDDAPPYAIRAFGTAAKGEGISVTGTKLLYVDGPIYSSGVVDVANNGAMRVNGSVNAVGDCSGPITSTDRSGLHCNPPAASATDPTYLPAIPDQSALETLKNQGNNLDLWSDPVPTCSANRIVFTAGYYGTAPDALVQKALPTCTWKGKVWEFTPGLYYFDYAGQWLVKDYQVVGGTVAASQTASDALGHACDPALDGVQFVFGGLGTIKTQSSSGSTVSGIELCGPPAGHDYPGKPQRLALVGLGADSLPQDEADSGGWQTRSAATGPADSPTGSWTNPGGARTIDTSNVATTVDSQFTEKKSATLTFTMPSNAVPKGAKITKVQLRVAQTLVNTNATVTITAPRLGSSISKDFNQASCLSISPCTTDITTAIAGGNDLPWRLLDNLTIAYEVTAKNDTGKTPDAHSAIVDGVDVQVQYTLPTYRQQTCIDSCTFFDSTTNPNVFMHGTVYTPLAAWAVNVHNDGESIFDRGIAVRTIDIVSSASSKQSSSPFQLPHGPGTQRYVYFQGYVDSTEKVRACVLFNDSGPTTAYYGYSVSVPHWLYLRSPSTQGPSC